jgi:hypothetical protein
MAAEPVATVLLVREPASYGMGDHLIIPFSWLGPGLFSFSGCGCLQLIYYPRLPDLVLPFTPNCELPLA